MAHLSAAYHGYTHQDLVTALALASLLIPRPEYQRVAVEHKVVEGDRFDDLELLGKVRRRVQIKSHITVERPLRLSDFTANTISFRIDDVIQSFAKDPNPAEEYRLFTTFEAPDQDLVPFVQRDTLSMPLLPSISTQQYRLDPNRIWPEEGAPLWVQLGNFQREVFVEFCRRFVIEINCPKSSGDLRTPGGLEGMLLTFLQERIGIGLWPNHNRDLADATAHLTYIAQTARATGATYNQSDLINALALRVDYGRVEENLPIDEHRLIPLPGTLDEIVSRLAINPRLVITGSPGVGKSWLIHQLASRLRQDGYIVANHYCYVSLFDNELSRRASVETTFGSIMAELFDAEPSLATDAVPRFAAGPHELEKVLAASATASPERRIAIIVDGLDHADRIPEATKVGTAAAIAQELSLLDIPPGVVILLGSQPGVHLKDFLAVSDEYHVDKWNNQAVQALAIRMKVAEVARSAGIENDIGHILSSIVDKADGNPLYATYLSRTATTAILNQSTDIVGGDIAEYLSNLPTFDNDLDQYYRWLVQGIAQDTGVIWIAELLSLIDFPISPDEIGQIKPEIRHHIDTILTHLAPVLIEDPVSGGIRIYHESFQRYIRAQLDRNPHADVASILSPVIDWLERAGFYADLRAFRALLKLLRQSGRDQEVVAKITDDYVALASAHGQPADTVLSNLAIAGRAAALLQKWSSLSQFVELARAANYLYQWRLDDHTLVEQYGRAYVAIFGANSLSSRLLYEHHCTFPPRPGLILCRLCDEEGSIPPWVEYRNAHDLQKNTDNTVYGSDNDKAIAASRLTGRLRLNGLERSIQECKEWLISSSSLSLSPYEIVFTLGLMYGSDAVAEVIGALPKGEARAWAHLVLAQFLDEPASIKREAQEAILNGLPWDGWNICLSLGANPQLLDSDALSLHELTSQVILSDVQFHREWLLQWLTAVRLAGISGDEAALFGTEALIPTDTWFHRWLRFCVLLSHPKTTADDILTSLRDLSENIEVFQGSPRVCDLYSLHADIQESFREVLGRLNQDQWVPALDALTVISKQTITWLMGASSGPLPLDVLLEIGLEMADTDGKRHLVSGLGALLISPENRSGEYYDTHAQDYLVLVRLHMASGEDDLARKAWNQASQYLAAYGWRKDITIYELLDPLHILASADPARSRKCICDIQPAVERVLVHTDGKETRHAIHTWLDQAASFHPAGALSYLADIGISDIADPGNLYHALPKALAALGSEINSVHAAAGWLAAGAEARSEPRAALSACELTIKSNPDPGKVIWAAIVGSLDGDGVNPVDNLKELAGESARRLGLVEPEIVFNELKSNQAAEQTSYYVGSIDKNFCDFSLPILPHAASSLQIAHAVRQWYAGSGERPKLEHITNIVGWKLIELIDTGDETTATILLERIAHDTPFWERESLLPNLAEGLSFHGEKRLAALMYTFAYTRASDGWRHFAGSKAEKLFSSALSLDADLPWSILAQEVSEGIARGGDYGINAHLIELLATNGRVDDAFSAWEAACRVVNYRLPSTGPYDNVEIIYDEKCEATANVLASTIVARINSRFLHEKRLAVAAAALVACYDPSAFSAALKHAIANKAPSSTIIVLLQIVELFEQAPYSITKSTTDELYQLAICDLVSARALARQLLERAGLPYTWPPPVAMPITTTISDDRTTEIIKGIGQDRIMSIDELWPEYGKYIAGRIDTLLKSQTLKKEMQHALRDVNRNRIGRHLDAWYAVDEEIERVLQTTGASVRLALAQEGVIDPHIETEVGLRLLNKLQISIRLPFSRYVRPAYIPLPSTFTTQTVVSEIPIVPDGEFAGWMILAHYETELRLGNGYDKPVESKINTYSGIVFTDAWNEGDTPLGYGHSSVWYKNLPIFLSGPFGGPLAGIEMVRDPFGRTSVLVPHPVIPTLTKLLPAPFDRGLTMIDSGGHKAVACRIWRRSYIGDEYAVDQEPIFEGQQLLMRPDIYQQIAAIAAETAKYMTTVRMTEPE